MENLHKLFASLQNLRKGSAFQTSCDQLLSIYETMLYVCFITKKLRMTPETIEDATKFFIEKF